MEEAGWRRLQETTHANGAVCVLRDWHANIDSHHLYVIRYLYWIHQHVPPLSGQGSRLPALPSMRFHQRLLRSPPVCLHARSRLATPLDIHITVFPVDIRLKHDRD